MNTPNRNKLIDTENKLVVTRWEEFGRRAKKVKGIKMYKLPVINIAT